MTVAPSPNSRRWLLLVIILIIGVSLFVTLRWWPSGLPLPTPELTPLATLVSGPATYLDSTKLTSMSAVKVNLPAPWQVIQWDADQFTRVLGKLDRATLTPARLDALKTLLSAIDPNSTALVALLLDGQATNQEQLPPNLTVMVAPRNGLSLDRYLEGITTNLSSQSGVTLHESQIDRTLRPENLPVATVHYTVDDRATTAPIDGYQIAAYDAQANHLIIFTFTTPAARYDELLPLFQEIVRTAQLN